MAQQSMAESVGLTLPLPAFSGRIKTFPGPQATPAFTQQRAAEVQREDQRQNPRRLLIYTDASKEAYQVHKRDIYTGEAVVEWHTKLSIAAGWQEWNDRTGRMDWKVKTQDMTHQLLRGTWKVDRLEFEALKIGVAHVAGPFSKGISPSADEHGNRIGSHSNPWVEETGPNITEVAVFTDSDNALRFVRAPRRPLQRVDAFYGAEFAFRRLRSASQDLINQGIGVELVWIPRDSVFGNIWVDCWAKIARGIDPRRELECERRFRRQPHWQLWWDEMEAQGRLDEFS
ncbi:hypothetical protein DIS24_g9866 [Lasiodiplodia hormozganensis]|uniref:Uncharacterized protein n=1 Tax=Lasiodiplodia hormozganensis TaxID=869390 RepID=A0AA39XQK6_9PEZI|nr:hypothetical protein DIS24_g9866 [Lasiodiplodia hormozganensis]